MDIIIIVGHGNPDKEASMTSAIAERLHRMIHPGCNRKCVRDAYLQFMKPGLMEAIRDAAGSGAQRVIIHPFFLSSGFHVGENIPGIIRSAEDLFPDIEFICTAPLGNHEKLAEVVFDMIQEAIDNKA